MTVLDDLVSALEAAGINRAYKLGAVPTQPAYPYVVVSSAPAAPEVRDLGGSGNPAGRFTVQHVGKTAESIEGESAKTFAAFDGKALPLSGQPVAWQELSTPPFRDPDAQGVLTALHTYRY